MFAAASLVAKNDVASGVIVGREPEIRRLRGAIQRRESQLIWGRSHSGKTFLIRRVIAALPDADRRKCVCWTGPATGRQLVSHFIRELYLAGDTLVRRKIHADRAGEFTLDRWINDQTLSRLRSILYSAAEHGDYCFFVDHLPSPTHHMAHLLKDLMYRCKTPVYFTGTGYSREAIGYAWSLYWADEYRIELQPLTEAPARQLLESCIRNFGLSGLDLERFREEILRFSGRLPGSIVKMCELAADQRYHYGDRVKVKLVHVEYLLRGGRFSALNSRNHPS